MNPILTSLSPRQHECLRLSWERLTSKEIALRLALSPRTVDSYIAEAVEALGAADRREAARMVFGASPPAAAAAVADPRNDYGGEPARVAAAAPTDHEEPATTGQAVAGSPETAPLPQGSAASPASFGRPFATREHPRNTLTPAATCMWIGIIAIASLVMLALTTSIGFGLASIVADWRGGHQTHH
jgi:DNA-binding CsgD family transcriptional regulator